MPVTIVFTLSPSISAFPVKEITIFFESFSNNVAIDLLTKYKIFESGSHLFDDFSLQIFPFFLHSSNQICWYDTCNTKTVRVDADENKNFILILETCHPNNNCFASTHSTNSSFLCATNVIANAYYCIAYTYTHNSNLCASYFYEMHSFFIVHSVHSK